MVDPAFSMKVEDCHHENTLASVQTSTARCCDRSGLQQLDQPRPFRPRIILRRIVLRLCQHLDLLLGQGIHPLQRLLDRPFNGLRYIRHRATRSRVARVLPLHHEQQCSACDLRTVLLPFAGLVDCDMIG